MQQGFESEIRPLISAPRTRTENGKSRTRGENAPPDDEAVRAAAG